MEKRKLLSVVLFCFCFAGITLADEVINVDLNAQGDDAAYTGEGAIAGETVWRAIYEGTGVAVGSARTALLANYDEPNKSSTYAAQVWLTIPVSSDFSKEDNGITGNLLMDDGFQFVSGTPYIYIPGEPQDGNLAAGAYNGTYDIYVYCSAPTTVTLQTTVNYGSQNVTATYAGDADGPIPSTSYVVFNDVVIDDGSDTPGDGNSVTISWTQYLGSGGIINGITLVKVKSPLQIDSDSYSGAPMYLEPNSYDVAKDTNFREGEGQHFGPDLGNLDPNLITDPFDYVGPALTYIDNGEYMTYDIECSESDAGSYLLKADVVPDGNSSANLLIYYYNSVTDQEIEVGEIVYTNPGGTPSPGGELNETSSVTFNIFAGSGYIKWTTSTEIYFNLVDLKMYNLSTPPVMDDCADVYFYKYNYVSDYVNDCRVDGKDLRKIVDRWVTCYDPNTANCP